MERLYQVSGCSMLPTLQNGQIVEVVEGYRDGDVVVAEHEGRLVVKRLVGDRLLGDNRALSADFFVADVRILGRAEVRTKEELEERGFDLTTLNLQKVEAGSLWEVWVSDTIPALPNGVTDESRALQYTLDHSRYFYKITRTTSTGDITVYYQSGYFILDKANVPQDIPSGYSTVKVGNRSAVSSASFKIERLLKGQGTWPETWYRNDLVERGLFFDTTNYKHYAVAPGASSTNNATFEYTDPTGYKSTWNISLGTRFPLDSFNKYGDYRFKLTFMADAISYVRIEREKINSNPTISVTTQNNVVLSEGNNLTIAGSATDVDTGDVLTVKYKINSGTVRNIASGVVNGTPLSFAKNLTFSGKRLRDGTTEVTVDLAENVDHTLTVWAEDDKGGKSAEVIRKFRVIHNRPPVISGTNEDLGTIQAIPSKTYTVTEPEGDAFTVTEKIDGKVMRSFTGVAGQENTITIPHDMWIRLQPGAQHTLSIEATDSKGMTSVRTYTFVRQETKLEFELKQPFITDVAAKRILVTLDAVVPNGATMKIEACNNAFDASPAWEDITNHVRFNRGFLFTNTEKTAERWGVNIRFIFEKGTANSQVIVNGFGGAFD